MVSVSGVFTIYTIWASTELSDAQIPCKVPPPKLKIVILSAHFPFATPVACLSFFHKLSSAPISISLLLIFPFVPANRLTLHASNRGIITFGFASVEPHSPGGGGGRLNVYFKIFFYFLRSTRFKLLNQINGYSLNNCHFFEVRTYSYGRLVSLFAPCTTGWMRWPHN